MHSLSTNSSLLLINTQKLYVSRYMTTVYSKSDNLISKNNRNWNILMKSLSFSIRNSRGSRSIRKRRSRSIIRISLRIFILGNRLSRGRSTRHLSRNSRRTSFISNTMKPSSVSRNRMLLIKCWTISSLLNNN